MDDSASTGSPDDAHEIEIEQVNECVYKGRLGGFLRDHYCTISLHFYRDGALDGRVRQRRQQQLRGRVLLSTSRKRQRQHQHQHLRDHFNSEEGQDDTTNSVVCGYIHGRWMHRGDGRVGHFQVMKRHGHVDRQTLQCRAEFRDDATATSTWRLLSHEKAVKKETHEETEATESNEYQLEEEEESVIENVFEWKRVDRIISKHEDGVKKESASGGGVLSEDPLAVYPLTPGTYHFRGFTTIHSAENSNTTSTSSRTMKKTKKKKPGSPPRDECFVTMELFADGTLVGKSREVVYPQSCAIRGTWEVGRLRYVLEYKVREAVGFFKYSARVEDLTDKREEEAARALKGKWRNIDDNEVSTPGYTGGRGTLELVCVYRSNTMVGGKAEGVSVHAEDKEALEDKPRQAMLAKDSAEIVGPPFLQVFTTGRFVLKGKATDDDGYEYESQLEMELFDDGAVRGTCRELVYDQVQRLHGTWTRTTIQYELAYVVKKEVGRYWYKGRLESDGLVLHGAWCNMELLVDAPQAASYRGEKGLFAYAILEATRRWSHISHSDFPKAFRDRVRCVLLCSQRTHVLPSPLWSKIFVFCSHEWFNFAVEEMKREIKEESRVPRMRL